MTFTQAPIGRDKDKHGLKINSPEGKLGTETLDNLGEWLSNTEYGKRFLEGQQRDRELDQKLIEQGGPYAYYLKIKNTPNPIEQRILKGISDVTNIDERITTPATYLGLGAGIRGLSNVRFPRTYSKLTQKRILPKEERRMINITKDVDEIFNAPADVIRRARVIYRHNPDAGWTAAITAAKQLPKYAANAKIYLGDQPPTSTFMTTTGGDQGSLDLPDENQPIFRGRFHNVHELDRMTAARVQARTFYPRRGENFNRWRADITEDMKTVYKAIEAGELNDHHSNILKSGVSLHEGRDEYESMIIETWLVEDSVQSGDNPLNNHRIPEQVHGLTHRWLNERVGREYLTKLLGPIGSPLRRRWEQLPIDHPEVKSVVKQYAAYVNGATNRTAELMRAYYEIWGPESPITEQHLDLIYDRLNISELEYDRLIKPGLSKKDARIYNETYGRDKIEITWPDGKVESIHRRLLEELENDPVLIDKIERLNAKITGTEVTPYQGTKTQRQIWEEQLKELKQDLKTFSRQKDDTFPEGSEYKNAQAKIKALNELIHGKQLSLFRVQNIISNIIDKREPNPNATRHGGWPYKK